MIRVIRGMMRVARPFAKKKKEPELSDEERAEKEMQQKGG
jgi:hypothetical protein